jgi:hypothetical protein
MQFKVTLHFPCSYIVSIVFFLKMGSTNIDFKVHPWDFVTL